MNLATLALYAWLGFATWYGPGFHGGTTANGEVFDQAAMTTACHPVLLEETLEITSLETGESVVVRCNDTGPWRWTEEGWEHLGRDWLDLSQAAFERIAPLERGVIAVEIAVLERPPDDGEP